MELDHASEPRSALHGVIGGLTILQIRQGIAGVLHARGPFQDQAALTGRDSRPAVSVRPPVAGLDVLDHRPSRLDIDCSPLPPGVPQSGGVISSASAA